MRREWCWRTSNPIFFIFHFPAVSSVWLLGSSVYFHHCTVFGDSPPGFHRIFLCLLVSKSISHYFCMIFVLYFIIFLHHTILLFSNIFPLSFYCSLFSIWKSQFLFFIFYYSFLLVKSRFSPGHRIMNYSCNSFHWQTAKSHLYTLFRCVCVCVFISVLVCIRMTVCLCVCVCAGVRLLCKWNDLSSPSLSLSWQDVPSYASAFQ